MSTKDKAGAPSTSGVKRKASEMTASDPPAASSATASAAAATAAATAAPPVAPALARSDSSSSVSKRQKTEDGTLKVLRRRWAAQSRGRRLARRQAEALGVPLTAHPSRRVHVACRVIAELKDIVTEQEKGTLKGIGAAPREENLCVSCCGSAASVLLHACAAVISASAWAGRGDAEGCCAAAGRHGSRDGRDHTRHMHAAARLLCARRLPCCRFVWDAFIKGPEGSPYEDGIFNLIITIPEGAWALALAPAAPPAPLHVASCLSLAASPPLLCHLVLH